MDIIPEDEELVIEAQVKPHVIDRVKVLDIVDIRFSSFSKAQCLFWRERLIRYLQIFCTDKKGSHTILHESTSRKVDGRN